MIDSDILDEIFLSVFNWETLPSKTSINKNAIEMWDSMIQLNLVSAIESEFDIVIALDEALAITSYSVAESVIAKHIS